MTDQEWEELYPEIYPGMSELVRLDKHTWETRQTHTETALRMWGPKYGNKE